MRNSQGNSPLVTAWNLTHGTPLRPGTKRQALKYIVEEMEEMERFEVNFALLCHHENHLGSECKVNVKIDH